MLVGPALLVAVADALIVNVFGGATDVTVYDPLIVIPPAVVGIGNTMVDPTDSPLDGNVTETTDDPEVVVNVGTAPPFVTAEVAAEAATI